MALPQKHEQQRFSVVPPADQATAPARRAAAAGTGPRVSPEHHAQIRSRAKKFLEENNLSQGRVNKLMGFAGGAVLSGYLNESYRGDNDRVARKLESFMDTFELQLAFQKSGDFVETSAVTTINEYISLAEATIGITRIVGTTGCGKSMTLKAHRLRTEAILLSAAAGGMSTPRSVLAQLWPHLFNKQALGRMRTEEALRAVVGALETAPRTIMVDESQYATPLAAETLRCIADLAGVAVVLAGEEWCQYSGAFEGRIVADVYIGEEFFTEIDIERVVGSRLNPEGVREVMPLLLEEARTSGGFRRVHRVMQHAQSIVGKNAAITADSVMSAVKKLRKAKGGAR